MENIKKRLTSRTVKDCIKALQLQIHELRSDFNALFRTCEQMITGIQENVTENEFVMGALMDEMMSSRKRLTTEIISKTIDKTPVKTPVKKKTAKKVTKRK